jgi:alkanesulfonate monooxygenase SsuD/methylene tetrahydromethanopterin reductase-like flavin-dependent oxidoreductase (luciferase family)
MLSGDEGTHRGCVLPSRHGPSTRPGRSSVTSWVAADDIPLFESVWNWDHFYPLSGDLTGPNFEGWTMLAAMAQR